MPKLTVVMKKLLDLRYHSLSYIWYVNSNKKHLKHTVVLAVTAVKQSLALQITAFSIALKTALILINASSNAFAWCAEYLLMFCSGHLV